MTSKLPAPYLIADHKGLEIVNTVGAPYGDEMDWLQNGSELLAWMRAVDLLSAPEVERLQQELSASELDRAAETLRDLRGEMQANVPDASPGFLERLNAILTKGRGHYEIATTPEGEQIMRFQPLLETGQDLVVRVAVDVAEMFCLNSPDRIRKCANPDCTYWFHDTTRNNRRRWCSMAVCGNRAKVAAHRARK